MYVVLNVELFYNSPTLSMNGLTASSIFLLYYMVFSQMTVKRVDSWKFRSCIIVCSVVGLCTPHTEPTLLESCGQVPALGSTVMMDPCAWRLKDYPLRGHLRAYAWFVVGCSWIQPPTKFLATSVDTERLSFGVVGIFPTGPIASGEIVWKAAYRQSLSFL